MRIMMNSMKAQVHEMTAPMTVIVRISCAMPRPGRPR